MQRSRTALLLLAVSFNGLSFGVAQVPGLTLTVKSTTGRTEFRIGERIPLSFTFSSANDTDYIIDSYLPGDERMTGSHAEAVSVQPSAGWADPLATYLAQGLIDPITAEWPQPRPLLRAEPFRLSADLNRWIRFDQPGLYHVHIVSHRVFRNKQEIAGGVTSNTMELRIVPATPEWQSEKLKSVQALLASPRLNALTDDAARDLSYLATPAAIDQMTLLLGKSSRGSGEAREGLLGVPDSLREIAIGSMDSRLKQADISISPWFMETFEFLHVTPGSDRDSIRRQLSEIHPRIWSATLAATVAKQPDAQAKTLQTLLMYMLASKRTADDEAQIESLVRTSFSHLDAPGQADDLARYWDQLRGPEIVPTLQKLAQLPPLNDEGPIRGAREMLKSLALQRWYELDPSGSRKEALAQIGSATPSLSALSLRFLPSAPLPQFEPLWAIAFLGDTTGDQRKQLLFGTLLVEFGSGAASAEMEKVLAGNPLSNCVGRSLALAYLVRFNSDRAQPLLHHELITDAGGCDAYVFQSIRQYTTVPFSQPPLLNQAAVDSLDSPNPRVVYDALGYLTLFATAADRASVRDHLARWHEKWKDRSEVFDHPASLPDPLHEDDRYEGPGFLNALMTSQGWLPDDALKADVLRLCIGEQMCQKLKKRIDEPSRLPLMVWVGQPNSGWIGNSAPPSIVVGQYQPQSLQLLDKKLGQFPRGSEFILATPPADTSDQRGIDDQVRAAFARNNLVLINQADWIAANRR